MLSVPLLPSRESAVSLKAWSGSPSITITLGVASKLLDMKPFKRSVGQILSHLLFLEVRPANFSETPLGGRKVTEKCHRVSFTWFVLLGDIVHTP